MGKDVVVCIARHMWSNPCYVERDKYYYINDGKGAMLSNIEDTSIRELAEILHDGTGISGPVTPEDKIIYEPHTDAETFYIDGYFGRMPIPAEVYCYEPLKRKQIEQLERHLARLRQKERN